MNEQDQAFLASVEAECRASRPVEVTLVLGEPELISLCGLIQLALRHPSMPKKPTGRIGRQLVEGIISSLPPGRPLLKELLRRGFDPNADPSP